MTQSKDPSTRKLAAKDIKSLRGEGKRLFELGNVYVTPAVLAHLDKHSIYPRALLAPHCHGDYGQLDDEDKRANDNALTLGSGRILSAYVIEGIKIYVITDRVDELGVPTTTTIMATSEY